MAYYDLLIAFYREGTGLLWNLWTELTDKVLPMADRDYESRPSTCSLEVLTENLQRMTADAIEQGCDPNMVTISHHESLLHLFIESYSVWGECGGRPMSMNQISDLVSYAIAMGCDLEARDSTGKTPLLTACQFHEYHIFGILVHHGANVTALDNIGQNALHLLLNQPTELTKPKRKYLEHALVIAIGNKCDLNGLSIDRGLSPVDYAKTGYGWIPLTQALALFKIHVVEANSVSDNEKLALSDMTVGSWKAERSRIQKEYEERRKVADGSECDYDAPESFSVASVGYENITEWGYDSEA
jgi:hypothetical protein